MNNAKVTKLIISFITSFLIVFNCHANDNYYTNWYDVEYNTSSNLIGQTIDSRIPLILKKGKYENCNYVDFFSEDFDCLSNKESSHFLKRMNGTQLISYEEMKELKNPVNYTVYKEYRLVNKDFLYRLFNSPIEMVILKTKDEKTIEMDKLFFTYYMLKEKNPT